MIIDLILDRKDSEGSYSPSEFYRDLLGYAGSDDITLALDYGEEADVQKALCDYIDANDYNPTIKDYILTRNWLIA